MLIIKLYEIKQEILVDYTGEFEMVGTLKVGDQIRQTQTRSRKFTDNEAYFISLDEVYDAEDSFFNDFIYKIITLQFNLVKRSQYGNGCEFKHGIIENRWNICFLPTKRYCFVKCVTFITGEDYKEQCLDFIRNEKIRSKILTKARLQPFCRGNSNNLGYFDGTRVFPRSVTNRDSTLFLYNNHFCLIWESEGVNFKQTIKKFKDNLK